MKGLYSVSELCEALGVCRSGYYAARSRPPAARTRSNAQLVVQMQAIHSHRHTRSYGSPRMTRELKDTDIPVSVNRVARLMRGAGLRVAARAPYPPENYPI